jgi:lipoate-protein ligase A
MQLLDLTLPTPAENLALDEALLEASEAGEFSGDILRLWEMAQHAVILGRSSRASDEVDLSAAHAANVPILRRSSGGAAVVAGPGCLMYSIVLRYEGREHLRLLDEVHRHVLGIIRSALSPFIHGVEHVGICDLAVCGRKFSGNSLRCKRDHLLYHGTLLYNFDLKLVSCLLRMPPRQPAYRGHRSHADFLTNIPVTIAELRGALFASFAADSPLTNWPHARTAALVISRYSQSSWNLQR